MSLKATFRLVFWVVLVMGFWGCNVNPVYAPKDTAKTEPVTTKVRTFSAEDLVLKKNDFFLWKKNFQATEVSSVLTQSQILDELTVEMNQLIQNECAIAEKLKSYGEVDDSDERIEEIKKEISDKSQELHLAEQDQTPQGLEKAKSLREAIDRLTSEKLLREDFVKIENQKSDLEVQESSSLRTVLENTEPYSKGSPREMSFKFLPRGQIEIEIKKWKLRSDPKEKAKNFSTRDESVQNVSYSDFGGVFTFQVVVRAEQDSHTVQEIYDFNVFRNKYSLSDLDHHIYFSGEFVRRMNPDYCKLFQVSSDDCADRRGIVNLSN